MENSKSICTQTLVNNVVVHLTGNSCKSASIVKVNSDNLTLNGDLHFIPSLKAWKSDLADRNACDEKCTTILQHFAHVRGRKGHDSEIAEEVLQTLLSASKDWLIKIERFSIRKERICLFLNRTDLTTNAIRVVVEGGRNFGRCPPTDKVFTFESYEDGESQLTTARLRLIKDVTEKILKLQGCKVADEPSATKFLFTTKSEGRVKENYEKYICGVVKNLQSNSKETCLSWEEHYRNKINELEELNEQKFFEAEQYGANKDIIFQTIGKATVTFELLAVKPSRPVFIGLISAADKSVTNTKGVPFILYNTARIATILAKYESKRLKGEYPDLPNINDVNFNLLKQEEEWELVYNFIVGYSEMIRECLKLEPVFQTNPQVICLFLSRLSQKFSVYYRKIRILTEAYDHLIPTMVARLYLLRALQIIFQNALAILEIDSVSQM